MLVTSISGSMVYCTVVVVHISIDEMSTRGQSGTREYSRNALFITLVAPVMVLVSFTVAICSGWTLRDRGGSEATSWTSVDVIGRLSALAFTLVHLLLTTSS